MATAAKTGAIPPFVHTSVDEITSTVNTLRATFRSGRTKDIEYRKKQIRRLYWSIVDNTTLLQDALMNDMGKSKYEAIVSEIDWCKRECLDVIENIDKWAKDEYVVNMPKRYFAMRPRVRNEPLGLICIIGAYNFPFQLNITAVIGAIISGNTVLLKPSELSTSSAMMCKKLMDDALDRDAYACINGAVDETKHLLEHKFDKIVFTGGKRTGTIIAKKAAETLTPVLLELGGQNPAFVTKNANLKTAARRLLWQKCLNAGQVCLSHNYVLVDRRVQDKFIEELKAQYKEFMPAGAEKTPDFARVVNKGHFDRLKRMLDNSTGRIVMGGALDESRLFIEPTVVLVDDVNDSMIVEESFGPIWSIMAYDSLDAAIDIANEVDSTPLALYAFGSDAETDKILKSVTSGGATVNDAFFHVMSNPTPFGGVGNSGQGNYHGYYSFKAFSHQRSIARVPNWAESLLRVRYFPYKESELKNFRAMNEKKPNFDRNGNVVKGLTYWISMILSLGSKSAGGFVFRWGLFVALAAALGLKRQHLGL